MVLPLLEERAGVRADVETNFFPGGILICRINCAWTQPQPGDFFWTKLLTGAKSKL